MPRLNRRVTKSRATAYGIVAGLGALTLAGCSSNSAPEMRPFTPPTFFVGSRQDIQLRAYDADGDSLTYGFSAVGIDVRGRAEVRTFADEGSFSWEPIASDVGTHDFEFNVTDGRDTDSYPTRLTVRPATSPGNGPRFIKPLGTGSVLDLNLKGCIDVDVLVQDADSPSVDIRQSPPISSSELRKQGGLAAVFHWCPTAAQQVTQQWTLRLVADDRENPPVSKDFTIVLIPKGQTLPDAGVSPDGGGGGRAAPFTLDFEGDNGGLKGTKDWEWGKPAFTAGQDCSTSAKAPVAAHSGAKVWGTRLKGCYRPLGNHADACKNKDPTDDSVLSLRVRIPASMTTAMLRFYQWVDYYRPFDWVEIRANGAVVFQDCKASFVSPTAWTLQTVDLSIYAGKIVDLEFHFMASTVVNYSGWYIDDLSISGS